MRFTCFSFFRFSMLTLFLWNATFASAAENFILGVHPFHSFSLLKKQFSPLTEYLTKKLGREIQLRVGVSYEEHIRAVGEDQVDIAYMGPVGYVQMVAQYGLKNTIVAQDVNGEATFKGIIFTKSDSSYNFLSEIHEGDFAFVDLHSTMGFMLPSYVLLQENPTILKQKHYRFARTHENVALGVLSGEFVAGATKESVYYAYKEKGLKQLAVTPKIAEHLFVCRNTLPSETVERIKKAFADLNTSAEGLKIMHAIKPTITRFVSVEDSAYDPLRAILAELKRHGVTE